MRRHIQLCVEAAQIYGRVSAFDMKRIVRRWPDLAGLARNDLWNFLMDAVGRLCDLERAAAEMVPEQAPGMVTGAGGAQPVPPQAPALPRQQPAAVDGVRASPKPGVAPFLPAAAVPRERRQRQELARRILDTSALRKCGTVIPLADFDPI